MGEFDWGTSMWDVDSKANALHKSLFGAKNKKSDAHNVKADIITQDKNEKAFGADSDDEENLSKKAKKKLKERQRKENKRNKKEGAGDNGNNPKPQDLQEEKREEENDKTKAKKMQSKNSAQKQRPKNPQNAESNGSGELAGISKPSLEKSGEKKVRKRNRKRKNSTNEENVGEIKAKSLKPDKENKGLNGKAETDTEVKGEPKKKRKRVKKKKPNSKKNKFKHLGLKSKSDNQMLSGSDDEDGNGPENISNNETVKLNKGKKRTNSESTENTPAKKPKLKDDAPAKKSKLKDDTPTVKSKLKDDTPTMKSKLKGDTPTMKSKLKGDTPTMKSKLKDETNNKVDTTLKSKKKNKDKYQNGVDGEKKTGELIDEKKGKKSKKIMKSKTETGVNQFQKLENGSILNDMNNEQASNTNGSGNSQSKRALKRAKKEKKTTEVQNVSEIAPEVSKSPFFSSQGNELQQRMIDKLSSARFRFINEQLYTIRGGDAFRMFQQDKTLMDAYNTGFQGQAKHWSVNPLDVIIKQLKTKSEKQIVADFGCGEARLSASIPQKVHSFDLFALNERVTVCEMSKTSLDSDSVDVVVFCLSLMGINLNDYLLEANRILKEGGLLKIAEVQSRFTNPDSFISAVSSIGFKAVNTRELSKMFYLMDFKKVKKIAKTSKQIRDVALNPCVYKKR